VTLLDKPAQAILRPGDEEAEDRYLLVAGLQESGAGSPTEITEEFHRTAMDGGGTVREALANMQAPPGAPDAVRAMELSRDELRAHAEVKQRQLDAAGTVDTLDEFSAAQALVDPVIREQRWLRAQRQGLAATREQWEAVDRPALEVGRDHLADADQAEAQRELTTSVRILDSALAAGRREGIRNGSGTRALDAAISDARSKKISLAAGGSTGVKILDDDSVHWKAMQLVAAEGGNATDGKLILDAVSRIRSAEATMLDLGDAEKRDAQPLAPGIDVVADKNHRLEQVRQVAGGYDGLKGAELFFEHDRASAARGIDLVKTKRAERDRSVREGILNPGGRV
jgi:hypothetical protein